MRIIVNLLKKILKIALVLAIIFGIMFAVVWGKQWYEQRNYKKHFDPVAMNNMEYVEELHEQWKSTPSDIEGMTQYDKRQMGLYVEDGSDSDHDGLTDKEEIEVYHTDPTAYSSAGDYYSDSYKIANGMDLDKKYDTPEEAYDYYIVGDDIKFVDPAPNDSAMSFAAAESGVSLYKDNEEILEPGDILPDYEYTTDYKFVKAYYVRYYYGDVEIDLTDLPIDSQKNVCVATCEVHGIPGDYPEGESNHYFKEIPSKVKDGKVTFNAAERVTRWGGSTWFCVVEKQKSTRGGVFGFFGKATDKEAGGEAGEYLAVCDNSYAWGSLHIIPPKIYYVSSGDETADEVANTKMAETASKMHEPFFEKMRYKPEDAEYIKVTKLEYEARVKLYQGKYQRTTDVMALKSFTDMFHNYFLSEDVMEEQRAVMEANHSTGFHMRYDTLPFANYSSEMTDGHCAGIAELTTRLYNTGTIPATGSYTLKQNHKKVPKGTVAHWDLTYDPENATLMDWGLYDFKDENFISKHTDENGELSYNGTTDGEKEFIRLVDAYWAEANETMPLSEEIVSSDYLYTEEEFMKILAFLDTGKICTLDLWSEEFGGHSVNIVAYNYVVPAAGATITDDCYALYIYDNNYPPLSRILYVHNYKKEKDVFPLDMTVFEYYPEDLDYYYTNSWLFDTQLKYWEITEKLGIPCNKNYVYYDDKQVITRYTAFVASDENYNQINPVHEKAVIYHEPFR